MPEMPRSEEAREIGGVCDYTVVPSLIHGLRRWTLYLEGSRWRLGSVSQTTIWPPREPMVTTCVSDDYLDDELPDHAPPGGECACGVYAQHPFSEPAEELHEYISAPEPGSGRSVGWTVCGVVAAWGRVEVHQAGFRAQFAQVAALLVPDNWRELHYGQAICEAAAEYGVPAIEIASSEQLASVCAERWPGLTEELVDDLLVDEFEMILEPSTNATILRDGETVAGAGYVVDGASYEPWLWDEEWKLEHQWLRVLRVAGTKFTADAIQDERFAPGRRLKLVAEPENPHDSDAIAIYDEAGEVRAGYVPAAHAGDVGNQLRNGSLAIPTSIWHWRNLATGRRIGLCVAIAHRRLPIVVAGHEADDDLLDVEADIAAIEEMNARARLRLSK